MAHEGSEDSPHARDENALPAASLPAPALSPAPGNFPNLAIRSKPQTAASEWDFLPKKGKLRDDASESSADDSSEVFQDSFLSYAMLLLMHT